MQGGRQLPVSRLARVVGARRRRRMVRKTQGRRPKHAGGKLQRIPRCDEVPVCRLLTTVVRMGRRESLRRRDTRLQLPTYLPVKLTPEKNKKKGGAGEKRGARKARRLKTKRRDNLRFFKLRRVAPRIRRGGW